MNYSVFHQGQHEYTITHQGFSYAFAPVGSKEAKTVIFPWAMIQNFSHPIIRGRRHKAPLQIRAKGSKTISVWLADQELENFLNSFISHWSLASPGTAKRAVFNYTSEEKNLWWIWLVVSIFAVGGLGTLLVGDGYQSYRCGQKLRNGILVPAQVTKTKKDRRGNINWDLEFTTLQGEKIHGKRTPVAPEGYEIPTSNVGVVYSPDHLECWDLSKDATTPAINWAQRRFVTTLALGFGSIFVVTSIVLTLISIYKLRRRRPFKETVRRAALTAR